MIDNSPPCTAQKIKFSIKNFISKCDQIRWKLHFLWSDAENQWACWKQWLCTERFAETLRLAITSEALSRRCSVKVGFLKFFAKFIRKRLCRRLFLSKSQPPGLQLYQKETLTLIDSKLWTCLVKWSNKNNPKTSNRPRQIFLRRWKMA